MIKRSTLDNGIRVLSEQVPGCHSVSLGIWVNNGSRHEPAELNGISHFIEHMLFKGSERRSAQDVARQVDSVGAHLNGFTSREFSCYFIKILAEKLPMAVDLLGELLCYPKFDLDDIEKERKVILQEITMIEDNPEEAIHDQFAYHFWGGHPLGLPVTGTRRTMAAIDRQQMIDFINDRYRAGNLCVVAAGCLEHEELVCLAEKALGGISGAASGTGQAAPVVRRHIEVTRRDLEQTHICLGVAGLPQNHTDRYGIYVLNTILGGNMSSRLFQRIRENLGLAYSVYSFHHNHSDSGSFIVYAGTSADDAPLVVRSILDEMNRLRHSAISIEELQGAKDYLKGSMVLAMESMDNRMARLAKNELFLRDVGICVAESQALIDAVTLDLVQYLAESLFVSETLNLQVAGRVNRADFPDVDLVLG